MSQLQSIKREVMLEFKKGRNIEAEIDFCFLFFGIPSLGNEIKLIFGNYKI